MISRMNLLAGSLAIVALLTVGCAVAPPSAQTASSEKAYDLESPEMLELREQERKKIKQALKDRFTPGTPNYKPIKKPEDTLVYSSASMRSGKAGISGNYAGAPTSRTTTYRRSSNTGYHDGGLHQVPYYGTSFFRGGYYDHNRYYYNRGYRTTFRVTTSAPRTRSNTVSYINR